jgi:hypothetical protein
MCGEGPVVIEHVLAVVQARVICSTEENGREVFLRHAGASQDAGVIRWRGGSSSRARD